MDRSLVRRILFGFLLTVPVFALLFWFVDIDPVLAALEQARRTVLGLVLLTTIGWLFAWSQSLRTVLRTLDVSVSVPWSFFLFSGATFSNNVTPFGQAGGEPITAYLISRTSGTRYETGLAAIASVDTLNFVPSFVFATVGISYYAIVLTLSSRLKFAAVLLGGIGVVLVGGGYYLWTSRATAERRVSAWTAGLLDRVAGYIPRFSAPSQESIRSRIAHFVGTIEQVAASPTRLAIALGFSGAGWLFQAGALWLAFYAIGTSISFSVVLFAIPISAIAGVTPLPGGAGGIETVLVALLASATSVESAIVVAAVVIFRGLIYWVPTLIGGSVLAALTAKRAA
ncbi:MULTISPECIES: lysylphosphatidylglycerol synthase transmembrane domain-containing protein [unclassified Haladaptatus]|uniref:lysylphosphatidylglycerol synthase transmembrane domain-containing protein n=1 Tax=unclassified Haladaptatus TaxID=2622732 RepID=UPI00209C090D|nr:MULTISPECIES: lysylphosphatidylglycerol synthase transmembrane domain-containing protein [unclassified Haladaptatus]MCO8243287.1 flippase-like domain-containing protein [Haladaptatus sp. AB643]MCO8252998.1 flippase-like domain-containing protein [Haladaptatus sp. AB618]